MDPTRQIDAYCERTGPEFWAEPLNAATNLAFIVAALAALTLARRRWRLDTSVLALSLILLAIGIGSFLFHTFATAWAAVLDVLPIMLFILVYFGVAMHRFAGLRPLASVLATLGFLAAASLAGPLLGALLGPLIGSSTGYLPALIALATVGGWLALRPEWRRRSAGQHLLVAAALFTVSLTFRVLDQPLCPGWPSGTHFLWHVLNAAVLFTVLLALIRHGGPLAAPAASGYDGRHRQPTERP